MNDVWYMVCIDPKQISAKLMMWCILCTGSFFNLPLWPYYNVTRRNVFHLIHLRCDSFINVKIALDSQNRSIKHSIKLQRQIKSTFYHAIWFFILYQLLVPTSLNFHRFALEGKVKLIILCTISVTTHKALYWSNQCQISMSPCKNHISTLQAKNQR